MYTYRYTKENGKPLTRCPECKAKLTEEGNICLVLSVSDRVIEVPSQLDTNGELCDTDDGAVAKGFHSETQCGECGESLVHYETDSEAV